MIRLKCFLIFCYSNRSTRLFKRIRRKDLSTILLPIGETLTYIKRNIPRRLIWPFVEFKDFGKFAKIA